MHLFIKGAYANGASDRSFSSARGHYSMSEAGENEAAASEAVQEGEAAKEAV